MNHKHRTALHALFAHPMSSNIDPKIVKSMLEELGAEITHSRHNHLLVTLNGFTMGFTTPIIAFRKTRLPPCASSLRMPASILCATIHFEPCRGRC